MSPETVGIIGIAILVVLLFARMWIGLAMAIIGFLGYAYLRDFGGAFTVVAQIPFTTIAYYPIACIPLFLLMGTVVSNTKMGEDLYDTAYTWIGRLRGGLAMATVIACALFAAITGVSIAAAATMSKITLPEMRRYKYDDSLASGCVACAGTLAILIPPSLAFILYGIITEQPIGKLFMAGIFPGILLSGLFILTIIIITTLRPEAGPAGPKTSFKEKIVSLKNTWHMILLFLLVLGGIYGGIFTPTEAGAVGAFGAILITAVSRRLTPKNFLVSLLEAGKTTAMVMLLIIGAFIFMKFLAVSKVPFMLGEVIAVLPVPPMVTFVGIVLLYVLLGMFLDVMSALVLTLPIIFPAIIALGFDPIWFGVIMVIVVEMGLVTPPVGMNVFVISGATDIPLSTVFRGVFPFLIPMIICIALLAIFPQIALFIPSMM